MDEIVKVWNTGDLQGAAEDNLSDNLERTLAFKDRTSTTQVVELRWVHDGKPVSSPFPATVLPDRSGVVLMDEWHFQSQPMTGPEPYPRHLRVLNPDGSLRLRIYPPHIDDYSRPKDSWIEEPRNFSERGIPFGSPASDGHYDMVVEYDWQTGQMLRWINAAPWLRY
ncbi:MAG: hypothetical protein QM788_05510 [Roseateles sp.]|uniref:hypothetical protein n=1 Tax=Roseateles sp. TaxID=1971397 RepID=UPI0039EC2E2D